MFEKFKRKEIDPKIRLQQYNLVLAKCKTILSEGDVNRLNFREIALCLAYILNDMKADDKEACEKNIQAYSRSNIYCILGAVWDVGIFTILYRAKYSSKFFYVVGSVSVFIASHYMFFNHEQKIFNRFNKAMLIKYRGVFIENFE